MTEAEWEFREFFAAEYGRLRGLGYLLTSDWAEAEELAQDALVRTYDAWPRVRRQDRPGAYARKVLVLRYHEDLPEAEVARLLGLPLGTVKSLAHRGLARLRGELGSPAMEALTERQIGGNQP